MATLLSARSSARNLESSHPGPPALLLQSCLQKKRLTIGDAFASAEPTLMHTLLGSCVAVCLHDPESLIGGMNHILLPGASHDRAPRFGVQAMELLINAIMKLGGDRRRLVAKAFGGANVLAGLHSPTVGELNTQFVRQFLAVERIPLLGQRLGGDHAVQVRFRTDTGKVVVQTVDGSPMSVIVAEEKHRASFKVVAGETADSTTLF